MKKAIPGRVSEIFLRITYTSFFQEGIEKIQKGADLYISLRSSCKKTHIAGGFL